MSNNKKAFTLIELLVVVAIIGILAAVGVVAYNGYTSSAKINVVKNNFKIAEKKLTEAITMCKSGLDFFWADGQNCQNRPINGEKNLELTSYFVDEQTKITDIIKIPF